MSELPSPQENAQARTKALRLQEVNARLKAELTVCKAEADQLKTEVERLRKFNDEALAHIAKEERKSRECLDMAQAEVERLRKGADISPPQSPQG